MPARSRPAMSGPACRGGIGCGLRHRSVTGAYALHHGGILRGRLVSWAARGGGPVGAGSRGSRSKGYIARQAAVPMMDFTLEEGALSPEAKSRLVHELTALVLELAGEADHEPVRPVTTCFVDEIPAHANVVDRPAGGRPVYTIVLGLPGCGGSHDRAGGAFRREWLVRRVTELVLEAEGTPPTVSDSLRVRVRIRDTRAGSCDALSQ